MYTNMCMKISLCLALIACIDGHVLKHQEVPLSPEGLTMEIIVKNKGDPQHPVSTIVVDIDEKNKKVLMSMAEAPVILANDVGRTMGNQGPPPPPTDFVPSVGNRHGIRVGTCPIGYTRRGGFCFPDDDY